MLYIHRVIEIIPAAILLAITGRRASSRTGRSQLLVSGTDEGDGDASISMGGAIVATAEATPYALLASEGGGVQA